MSSSPSLDAQQSNFKSLVELENPGNPVTLVHPRNLVEIVSNGIVSISLPEVDCDLKFKSRSVLSQSNSEYVWYGELLPSETADCDCGSGYLYYNYDNGTVIAKANIGNDLYQITPIGGQEHLFYKAVHQSPEINDCGGLGESERQVTNDSYTMPQATDRDGNCPVKLLVVYTPDAETAASMPIASLINNAVGELQIALANSRLSPKVRIEHVATYGLSANADSANVTSQTEVYIGDLANKNSELHSYAEGTQADLVVVMTGQDDPSAYGASGTRTFQSGRFVAVVVSFGDGVKFYTFAHEVAHLLGAKHQITSESPDWARAREFGYCKEHTTLVYAGKQNTRLLHISNPDVRYGGFATGTHDRDNASNVRNNICLVSDIRTSNDVGTTVQNLSCWIDDNDTYYSCPCASAFFSGNASGGPIGSTYNYTWEYSYDGLNWLQGGSGNHFWVSVSCEIGKITFVRLTVTATVTDPMTGNVVTQTCVSGAQVETAETWPGQPYACQRSSQEVRKPMLTYPNPFSHSFTVELPDIFGDSVANVELINSIGVSVLSTTTQSTTLTVQTQHLPSGQYTLRISHQDFSKTISCTKI